VIVGIPRPDGPPLLVQLSQFKLAASAAIDGNREAGGKRFHVYGRKRAGRWEYHACECSLGLDGSRRRPR
jgi:hypothetical protein